MSRIAVRLMLVTAVLFWGAAGVAAESPEPTPTRVKRVALFKNGYGFFVREGALSGANRRVALGPFAAPAHGTFWISSPSRARFARAVAREVTGTEQTPAREVVELLRGNVGRAVTVWLSGDPEIAVTGTLLAFAPDRPFPRPEPHAMGQRAAIIPPPGPGNYLLVETDDGVVALDPYRVSRVTFRDGRPSEVFPKPSPQVQLEAVFENPSRGDWLSVSYLARGITWAPSYLIDISDGKQARLSAKALVINEAEDLEGAHLDLITGFPHLEFADVLSPIGRRESLGLFLQALARGASRLEEASVLTQRVDFAARMDGAFAAPAEAATPMPDYGAAAAGQVAEDLFLYPVADVTLGKDETGYYPLFTEAVPYTEFHEWRIPDFLSPEGLYRGQHSDQPSSREVVWHCLRLTNATGMPWTTAPAQLMKEGQIVGQDTLGYTAPKGEAVVKITQAAGVKADQIETEVGRERGAVVLYGASLDRVTVRGVLTVANFTDRTVALEATKTLSGDVKETTPKAADVTLARGLRALNPTHELKWTLDVKPGETREMTYTAVALVRR